MAHDVFISYSPKDKALADAVCANLEANKIGCWIASRDENRQESSAEAINSSKVLVLILSSKANKSPQISKEVKMAVDQELPIIPFRIENIMPSKSMAYYISTTHWLDAIEPPLENHIINLIKTVNSVTKTLKESEMDNITTLPDKIYNVEHQKYNKFIRGLSIIMGIIFLGLFIEAIFGFYYDPVYGPYATLFTYIGTIISIFILFLGVFPGKVNGLVAKTILRFPEDSSRKLDHWININKNYNRTVILLILLCLLSSFATSYTSEHQYVHDSGGIYFVYPQSWFPTQNAPSAGPQETIASYGDPKSQNATGAFNTFVIVKKLSIPAGSSLTNEFNGNYLNEIGKYPGYVQISSRNVTVGGLNAYENIYKITVQGTAQQRKDLMIEKGGVIYYISCVATVKDFENEQKNFDLVINTFKVK